MKKNVVQRQNIMINNTYIYNRKLLLPEKQIILLLSLSTNVLLSWRFFGLFMVRTMEGDIYE